MFGLFQKQTLRQEFEDKQPQETLAWNRGVRQRKEEALHITTQNNWTNAFVMLARAVHPSASVLSEPSSLIWNWVFPTVMGGLNKWLRDPKQTLEESVGDVTERQQSLSGLRMRKPTFVSPEG